MYGLEGERRHMWSASEPSTSSVAATDSAAITPDSFSKDGRKIRVGDCALFKPPHESPPFIGIIRRLIQNKEDTLSLCVNWIYRPADIKLGKGTSLEAALNEVFYSFHKDEIPAASLLHPCKVAFLRKGVELPSGTSSFICRRVYDIENRCLWWLTDQDYINSCLWTQERQEEVDHLLDKTRTEMYGAVQSGGNSPKPLNGQTGAQLKPGSDSVHSNTTSLTSQVKGKKRDRSDQGSDTVKRERLFKADDTDSEQFLKSEIAKITDKGGLVDFEGVEKLVQLMKPDIAEKKIDLAGRMMLVNVISVTDRFECLGRFVQLKGLVVLDEWLQEVHKGKIGDSNIRKESEKLVEEFLLALLRALEKLPVNLNALQTCNVGKSVNHLRSQKSTEIQRKARSLVDTWKKRVEAEMNIIDSKSGSSRGGGSWPNSHLGNRRNGGSSEVDVKGTVAQSSTGKVQPVKLGSGEAVANLITPVSISSMKDLNSVIYAGVGTSDPPPMSTIKEENSSSSSQSQNNSQSCSSDLAKTEAGSCREDARSSTAGSVSANKISTSASRHRKSNNALQKESSLGKISSLNRKSASEKDPPTRMTNERVPDVTVMDHGSNQRLIVKLPNSARSPARSANGGSLEDSAATCCNVSPPSHHEKLDHHDSKVKGKSDGLPSGSVSIVKTDFCQGQEGNVSSTSALCDERNRAFEDSEKLADVSKITELTSPGFTPNTGKSYEASFSSMNALIESCVKFSEASTSVSAGDDIGMNLLASVAAGEIPRSDASPPLGSPAPEDSCSGNDANLEHLDEDMGQSVDQRSVRGAPVEQVNSFNASRAKDESQHHAMPVLVNISSEVIPDTSVVMSSADATKEVKIVADGSNQFPNLQKSGGVQLRSNGALDSKLKERNPLSHEDKMADSADEKTFDNSVVIPEAADTSVKVGNGTNEESSSCSSSEICGDHKSAVHKESDDGVVPKIPLEPKVGRSEDAASPSTSGTVLGTKLITEMADDITTGSYTQKNEKQKIDFGPSISDHNSARAEKSERRDGAKAHETEEKPASTVNASSSPAAESDTTVKLDFDLNEGFPVDDGTPVELAKLSVPENSSTLHLPNPSQFPISSMLRTFPVSITVAAAAKGPFIPPENPLKSKTEFGWKGSAATSAFRPAEPRKFLEMPLVDNNTSRQARPLLDIDLNEPDQRDLEDVALQNSGQVRCPESGPRDRGSGGLDLDLNRLDEGPEIAQLSVSNSCRFEIPQLPSRSSLSGGFSNGVLNASRDFDLNNGPAPDEAVIDTAPPHLKGHMSFLSPVPGVRMNSVELGNFSSWYPPSNSYSAIPIPSILPGRGEHSYPNAPPAGSQRIVGSVPGGNYFGSEIYRGPVLSSSPAIAFPSTSSFQYPGFPFETNFTLSSNSYSGSSTAGVPLGFPPISSQLVGSTGAAPSHYPRPYIMSHSGGTSNVSPENRKWGGQAFDLNSGPGGTEVRDERLLRQLPVAGSQVLSEEQLKIYQMAGGALKRKEPDGGWDGDRISYKQPSYQ